MNCCSALVQEYTAVCYTGVKDATGTTFKCSGECNTALMERSWQHLSAACDANNSAEADTKAVTDQLSVLCPA